jgi:hypothetical protein
LYWREEFTTTEKMSQTKRIKSGQQPDESTLISELLRIPDGIDLTRRTSENPTFPIVRYGFVCQGYPRFHLSEESIAMVSIPHNQILFLPNGFRSMNNLMPKIMGNNHAQTAAMDYHLKHYAHKYPLIRLMRVLLENYPDDQVSMLELWNFIRKLDIRITGDESADKIRRANKRELKRMLKLVDQQPEFGIPDVLMLTDSGHYPPEDWTIQPQTNPLLPRHLPFDLPTDVLGEISRHTAVDRVSQNSLRMSCKRAWQSKKMRPKRLRFHAVNTMSAEELALVISHTESIRLELAMPLPLSHNEYSWDDGSVAYREDAVDAWAEQQAAWPTLLSEPIISAFAQLEGLFLYGDIAADGHLHHFVARILTHPECNIKIMIVSSPVTYAFDRAHGPGFGKTLWHIGKEDAEAHTYNQVLANAVANNRSVTDWELIGAYSAYTGRSSEWPYTRQGHDNMAILKPWLDGLQHRSNLVSFKYNGDLHDHRDEYYRAPSNVLLNIVTNSAETLRYIGIRRFATFYGGPLKDSTDPLDVYALSIINLHGHGICKKFDYMLR